MPIPKPDLKMIKKVKEYRKQKLSYREIALLLNNHKRQVYRWDKYPVDKLSTIKAK